MCQNMRVTPLHGPPSDHPTDVRYTAGSTSGLCWATRKPLLMKSCLYWFGSVLAFLLKHKVHLHLRLSSGGLTVWCQNWLTFRTVLTCENAWCCHSHTSLWPWCSLILWWTQHIFQPTFYFLHARHVTFCSPVVMTPFNSPVFDSWLLLFVIIKKMSRKSH